MTTAPNTNPQRAAPRAATVATRRAITVLAPTADRSVIDASAPVVVTIVPTGSGRGRLPAGLQRRHAVVGQEDLLERRLPGEELRDPGGRQPLQERLDRAVHLAPEEAPDGLHLAHPRHAVEVGRPALEGHLDGERREVAEVGHRARLDQAPGAEDGDPVAEGLDLAEDVRREEDG